MPASPFVRHPWEIARARFFVRLIKENFPGTRPLRVLDVGAGDGYLAAELVRGLPNGSDVVCLDPHYSDEQIAALGARTAASVRFTRAAADSRADLLLLLDVIEHVPDDGAFLEHMVGEHLSPGGLALVSVPAWQALFTRHDVLLGHYRRYRPAELEDVCARAGLSRVDGGALFSSLLAPRLVGKLAELARGVRSAPDGTPPDHATTAAATFRGGRRLSAAISWVLDRDALAGRALARRGVALPGLSAWVLGRRP